MISLPVRDPITHCAVDRDFGIYMSSCCYPGACPWEVNSVPLGLQGQPINNSGLVFYLNIVISFIYRSSFKVVRSFVVRYDSADRERV
jgi:hypothetical protein